LKFYSAVYAGGGVTGPFQEMGAWRT